MQSWITVCDTCKRDGLILTQDGQTEGEKLADLIEAAAGDSVRVRRHSCLMGCARACNVTVQGAGKTGYTLADFEATPEDAQAIVEYARLHQDSATGQVPYKQWPQGVKGHFATRHPALPDTDP